MVQFLNIYFGSSTWMTLARLRHLRVSNKEQAAKFAAGAPDQVSQSEFSWLQLTPDHQDISIYHSYLVNKNSRLNIEPIIEEEDGIQDGDEANQTPSETLTSPLEPMQSKQDHAEMDTNAQAEESLQKAAH